MLTRPLGGKLAYAPARHRLDSLYPGKRITASLRKHSCRIGFHQRPHGIGIDPGSGVEPGSVTRIGTYMKRFIAFRSLGQPHPFRFRIRHEIGSRQLLVGLYLLARMSGKSGYGHGQSGGTQQNSSDFSYLHVSVG